MAHLKLAKKMESISIVRDTNGTAEPSLAAFSDGESILPAFGGGCDCEHGCGHQYCGR